MDQRTVGFVRIVLAHLGLQGEENHAARDLELTPPLWPPLAGSFFSIGSTGGSLRLAGSALCSRKPRGGMARSPADRGGCGCFVVGALASRLQLERSRHSERGARANPQRTVPRHSPPDIYGNSARPPWDRDGHGGSAWIARPGHCLAVLLRQGAPRGILSRTRVR